MSFTAYLWTLFTSALISSTVLPGGSEALVVFGMHEFQTHLWIVVFVATAGNTLGALITYGMGRLIPNKKQEARSLELLKKYGPTQKTVDALARLEMPAGVSIDIKKIGRAHV